MMLAAQCHLGTKCVHARHSAASHTLRRTPGAFRA